MNFKQFRYTPLKLHLGSEEWQLVAARNSLTVDASVTNSNLEWYVGRSCCSLLVPLVRRSLGGGGGGGIIYMVSISFKKGTYPTNFNTLIRMFNSVRIRIFCFRKPKKVSSDYRQDIESVELEDTDPFSFPFNLNSSRELAIRQHVFFFFFFFFFFWIHRRNIIC